MRKRNFLLGIAATAVSALFLPATVSALEWKDAGGKVALGSELTYRSTNTKVTNTALGDISCATVDYQARASVNGPTQITAVGTAAEWATCNASGWAAEITDPVMIHLNSVGNDLGSMKVTFVADVGPFECHYSGTVAFTNETGSGKDTITTLGVLTSPAELCNPEEGSIIYEGNYTVTTVATGQPVFVQ